MTTDQNMETNGKSKRGIGARVRHAWAWLKKPSASIAVGTLAAGGFVAGVVFWGGFNWAMELTNTEKFCISCHEMKTNVYEEYRRTVHYANGSGVRASCPDCHVPKEWNHKVVRKIHASKELFHHLLGSVSTPAKFNAKRIELAKNEWRRMKTTDSRECRNCHKFEYMDYFAQETRASRTHQEALSKGKTCIDCHHGIAHTLPPNAKEAYRELAESLERESKGALAGYLNSIASPARADGRKDDARSD